MKKGEFFMVATPRLAAENTSTPWDSLHAASSQCTNSGVMNILRLQPFILRNTRYIYLVEATARNGL
jgi:hypothetical protein